MPTDQEREDQRRRERVLSIVAAIFADGFAEGSTRVAREYNLDPKMIAAAAVRMEDNLAERLKLVGESLENYEKAIERKAEQLAEQGVKGDELTVAVGSFADDLANKKSDTIAQIEHGTGRLDGAAETIEETGEEFEWRFPHFDLGDEHEECPICEAIRENSPYTMAEAEEEGFPEYPHPNCDHGWVLVPKGEETLTEQNPAVPSVPRYRGGRP